MHANEDGRRLLVKLRYKTLARHSNPRILYLGVLQNFDRCNPETNFQFREILTSLTSNEKVVFIDESGITTGILTSYRSNSGCLAKDRPPGNLFQCLTSKIGKEYADVAEALRENNFDLLVFLFSQYKCQRGEGEDGEFRDYPVYVEPAAIMVNSDGNWKSNTGKTVTEMWTWTRYDGDNIQSLSSKLKPVLLDVLRIVAADLSNDVTTLSEQKQKMQAQNIAEAKGTETIKSLLGNWNSKLQWDYSTEFHCDTSEYLQISSISNVKAMVTFTQNTFCLHAPPTISSIFIAIRHFRVNLHSILRKQQGLTYPSSSTKHRIRIWELHAAGLIRLHLR